MIFLSDDTQEDFRNYLIYYPSSFSKGYDGIHDGGIKGIKKSAPDYAKKDFKDYVDCIKEDKLCGWKMIDYIEIDDE